MKRIELEEWQRSIDTVEDETRDHFDMEIPELAVGCEWKSPDGREWKKVPILYGAVGGRWCYWKRIDINGTHGDHVIVDTIFNGWSSFFAGMLRVPYDGHVTESLMLTKGGILNINGEI